MNNVIYQVRNNMNKLRNIAVIAIKNKEVLSAKVFNLSELPSVITEMELNGVERTLFTYLDGLTLNTKLPVVEVEKRSIIQSVTSEFEFNESRQKM
jgi:ribosome recycling factor